MERDINVGEINCECRNFNSHAHVERDAKNYYGMTDKQDFNSHAHVERDEIMPKNIQNLFISTHTLTWSVTRVFAIFVKFFTNFNSHAHVERDKHPLFTTAKTKISTHTLTWSVT